MSKKSLLHKSSSKSNSHSVRKERSSLIKEKKQFISELNFEESLKPYWKQFCGTNFPKLKLLIAEQPIGIFSSYEKKVQVKVDEPEIMLIFNELQAVLNCIIFKNVIVNRGLLISLRKILHGFDVLRTLKLEYCGLKNTDIRTVKTIVQSYPNIQTLSVNGNPNPFQNFYILIKDTHLLYLSARFCQINDRGTKLIANQLKLPYDHPLRAIDLSSNFISDTGAEFLSEVLRVNRTLLSLNLADNWITDAGVHSVVNILGKFILTPDECVIRRRGVLNYLRDKAKTSEPHEGNGQSSSSLFQKSCSETLKPEKEIHKKISRAHSLPSSGKKESKLSQTKRLSLSTEKLAWSASEVSIKLDPHPFVKDTYSEGQEIWCTGNLALAHLNISCKQIRVWLFRKRRITYIPTGYDSFINYLKNLVRLHKFQ
ncbi:uncharacterized protein LOC116171803 isoform X1 [Photinus pyralis]|uniref:uncharacterized protein LOC116171803 isoform X1 n=2 Tax=Photinus pyralis TaxID=7054 RepID=UPI0012674E4D|nr:uncharacterized protein LOC116171803 isoform X1 [Photinus pyralis]